MKFDNFEITLREAIFSITIASALFLIGFFISGYIEHAVNSSNMEYRQAAQISDTNEFHQAMITDIGNAFVEGDFYSVDKVTYEGLDGEWLLIFADYQEYRMHTQTYTTTDGKGHTKTKIRHYWSWDTYKEEKVHSKKVLYCGNEFDFEKFRFIGNPHDEKIVKIGHGKRIWFTFYKPCFHASSYLNFSNGTIKDKTELYCNVDLETLYNSKIESCAVTFFWVMWSLFMIGCVVMFVIAENKWIED